MEWPKKSHAHIIFCTWLYEHRNRHGRNMQSVSFWGYKKEKEKVGGLKTRWLNRKKIWYNDCISYLLPYNKLCQHLAVWDNKNFLSHSFCRSGIWAELGRLAQGLVRGCRQGVSCHCWLIWKLSWRRIHFEAHAHGFCRIQSPWATAIALQFFATCAFPRGSLRHSSLLLSKGMSKRAREGEQDRSQSLFFATWPWK